MRHLIDTLRGRGPDDGGVAWLTVIPSLLCFGVVVVILFAPL